MELECHRVACSFSAVSQTFSGLGFASLRKNKDSSEGQGSQGTLGSVCGGNRNVANITCSKTNSAVSTRTELI